MPQGQALAVVSGLAAPNLGVFRGRDAVAQGVSRKLLHCWCADGVITRDLPDTYRFTATNATSDQRLRAALLWAGDDAAAARRSAAASYQLEGIRPNDPEIVVGRGRGLRHDGVVVIEAGDPRALMVRTHGGIRVSGVEATLVQLAHVLDGEPLEVACEDARRRHLTSIPALMAYLARHARRGQRGVASLRTLLHALDPVHPSRSTLEVKTRRVLAANGFNDFVREFALEWNGRTYYYDFTLHRPRVILETNGRRWHDDPADYEHDHEKWSVPGRHGYKLVLATREKVVKRPRDFLAELAATLAS